MDRTIIGHLAVGTRRRGRGMRNMGMGMMMERIMILGMVGIISEIVRQGPCGDAQ